MRVRVRRMQWAGLICRHRYRVMVGVLCSGLLSGVLSAPLAAQELPPRPRAAQLLPVGTVAVVTCPDTRVLSKEFRDGSFYQMTRDPQLRPLLSSLYGNVVESLAQVQDRLGVKFGELLEIASGEMALAVVAPPRQTPQLILIADTDPLSGVVPRMLEELERTVKQRGGSIDRQRRGDFEVTVCQGVPGPFNELAYVRHVETLIVATRSDFVWDLLEVWLDRPSEYESLSQSQSYITVLNRTRVRGGQAAQVRWWVDPVALAYSLARDRLDVQTALTVLPVLAVDRLKGIGGSVSFGDELLDEVAQVQIFIEPPRDGIWEVIATRAGDCEPEIWVPESAASYFTINIDPDRALTAATVLFDTFQGEGALRELLRQGGLARRLGIDLQQDLWNHFSGRITSVSLFDSKPSMGAQQRLIGLHLDHVEPVRETLSTIVNKFSDRIERRPLAGIEYYAILPTAEQAQRRSDRPTDIFRPEPPQPVFAILDDCLVISDRESAFEEAVYALKNPELRLEQDLDFKMVRDQLEVEIGTARPLARFYNRPDLPLRNMYRMLQSPELRERLSQRGRQSPFWASVERSLQRHPLPPFAALQRYLVPQGGVWFEDELGWNYTQLSLAREFPL